MDVLVILAFFVLAAIVVFLSMKLGKYVDLLDKTTNVSGAFIGGVLLAAVTSLPELFTSLSAVLFLRENNLVAGNILGSNIFNLAALGCIVAVTFIGFSKAKIGKHHALTSVSCLVIYGLIALAVFIEKLPKLGFISIISPFIFVIYVLMMWKTPKTEESEEKTECELTTKQLIVRFVLSAVCLVGASIAITYASDYIAELLNLGKTFAGALLLGLTTSLPELVSTVSLCKRGNFNASFGNILGSNLFNFVILFFADLLSFRKGNTDIYPFFRNGAAGLQTELLLILGVASTVVALIMILCKCFIKPERKRLKNAIAISCGTLTTASYLLFLVLSTTLT
ncbi:MAG: cation transporter [Clostridiales bacterium]|nr:cation transporter [Clostridiales bacterium]